MTTMYSFLLLLSAVTVLQGVKGGWVEELVESHSSPVIRPLHEVTQELEANLAALELKKQELELHKKQIEEKLAKIPKECQNHGLQFHFSFFDKWDLDSCVKLTDDWKVGADLFMQGSILALNITETIGKIGNNILACPSQPILKVLPCYNTNIIGLKNAIFGIKSETDPFIHKARTVATTMKKDFDYCVGIPYTIKDKLESHISNIKC